MAKYLLQVSYSVEGSKGLAKEGGSARRAAAEQLAESVGGKIDAYYYAFGDSDLILIADIPDNASAAAVSLTAATSGAVSIKTTPLITVEEMDAAAKKSTSYRPPGA